MTDDELQFVIFQVGSQSLALSIFQVERILRWEQPAALPNAPAFLEGVLPYGDGVVAVVDLRKRLDVPATQQEETRVMVLELEDQRVGIVVDAVSEVVRVDARTITPPPPMVRGLAAKYITGILSQPDRTVVVLNAGKLLNSKERLALTGAVA
jgi:purine-binding chemotaxis protein CheW